MTATSSPAVLRRWIAYELRRLRLAAGLTQPDVAKAMKCAESRIGHMENQVRLPRLEFLEKLLRLYGAEDQIPKFDELLDLARKKYWWSGLSETRQPSGFEVYLGLEEGASRIDWYEPVIMPGLLQSPEYARVVIEGGGNLAPEAVAQRLELRRRRQEILTRDEPTHLWAVVEEQVLERPVGDEALMRGQFDHLLELANLPNVQVQIIPKSVGVYGGTFERFTILHFPMAEDPGVVYIETRVRAIWFEDQAEIEQYEQAMNHLRVTASSPTESRRIIERHRKEWR